MLLVSIFALIILLPLFEEGGRSGLASVSVLISLVPIMGLFNFSGNKKILKRLILLATPFLIFNWGVVFSDREDIFILFIIFSIFFYLYLIYVIFKKVTESKKVDDNIISGAVCAYVLLGVMWGSVYLLLDTVWIDSFLGEPSRSNLIYYSMITLTTLGYGDILPQSSLAKSMASLEAISGVMFSTIILARLVSLYGQEKKEK